MCLLYVAYKILRLLSSCDCDLLIILAKKIQFCAFVDDLSQKSLLAQSCDVSHIVNCDCPNRIYGIYGLLYNHTVCISTMDHRGQNHRLMGHWADFILVTKVL